jgi:hypothetical protein
MSKPDIAIYSGRYFNFVNPEKSKFTVIDIAHALSHLCRFTGHCNRFYSVAQHSVYVSRLCPPQLKLYGLLHDAPEAFLGDVSSPLKNLLPDYREIEERVNDVVMRRFGMSPELPALVKQADLIMLNTERLCLLNPCTEGEEGQWKFLSEVPVAPFPIDPMNSAQAKIFFLEEFYKLTLGS